MIPHNANKTCWNCPSAIFKGNVDFRACGQTTEQIKSKLGPDGQTMLECKRRPDLGHFEPTITFEDCTEWEYNEEYNMYFLSNMRVMILGIDGYLGWALALRLGSLDFNVSGIDNFSRRDRVAEKGSHTVVPIERMTERLHLAKQELGININFRKMDIRDLDKLREFLEEVKPEAVVHYAEIPSAPYSQIDVEHAIETQDNNTLGTLGLLFLMRDIVPETSMIKLGSMGTYGTPLTERPIFEGFFPADAVLKWDDREWSLGGEITPRNPISYYHCSKNHDAFNILEACQYWWLRAVDVQQGVIFGVHTKEVAKHRDLRTRFDIDEWFGTVLNRFVSQAVIGMPLTVYGAGEQIRGYIALDDAMQCMVRLIASPPEPGQFNVVNQVSGLHKVNDLAEAVARVGDRFGIAVKIQRLENPRVESDEHPLEVIATKLPNEFGFESTVTLEKEIYNMFELLLHSEIRKRIEEKEHVIMPKTFWSGQKKQPDVIEVYEPGEHKTGDYEGVFRNGSR